MPDLSKNLLQTSPRSLLLAAMTLHLVLALGTYFVARARVSPTLQADGVFLPFAPDALDYICYSELLADFIRAGDLRAWVTYPLPLHSKIYSLSFVVLSPFLGMSVLAGEPINLLLYAAILILISRVGAAVFNERVGLLSAVVVGLWPSFLLHTTQLLKEQFFVAALLLMVYIMVTWLTKPSPSLVRALLMGLAGLCSAFAIGRTRTPYWALLLIVFTLAGFVMLLIRQCRERQWFPLHMLTAVPILVALITTYATGPKATLQVRPSPRNPPTAPQSKSDPPEPAASMTVKRRLDLTAVRIWQIRWDYERAENGVGTIDNGVVFANINALVAYLPRAASIGFFAPFPNQWFVNGRQTGRIGRRVAALEMFLAYIAAGFAFFGLWRCRQNLAAWLLVMIGAIGVTTIALIVVNLGALYRMRYGFFIVMIPVASQGLITAFNANRRFQRYQSSERQSR